MLAAAVGFVALGLLAVVPAPAAAAEPPPPVVRATDGALAFVERRGDFHLRHYGVPNSGFAISDDGRIGATGSGDATAVVWDLRDGRVIRMIATPHINIWAVALSRDGSRLATCGPDGTVRMWDVNSGAELWVSKHDAGELRFSIDDKRLVGRRADELRVWEARDGRFVWGGRDHEDPRGGPSAYRAVVTPDGRSSIEVLAVSWCKVQAGCVTGEAPNGYVVKVIDLDTSGVLRVLSKPEDHAYAVGVSPAGDRVGILASEGLVVVDPTSGRRLASARRTIEAGRAQETPRVLLGSDPRYAVTWDGTQMTGWDLAAGKQIWLEALEKWEVPPLFAGKDTLFVAQFELCFGRRLSDGSTRWRRAGCSGGAASPSGTKILLGRGPSALDIADANSGASLLPVPAAQGPGGGLFALAVSADGARIAGLAEDRSAWVWEAAGGGRKLVDAPDPLWYPVGRFLSDGRLAIVNQTSKTDRRRIYHYDVARNALEAVVDVAQNDRFGLGGAIVGERVILEEVRPKDYLRTVVDLTGRAKPYHLPPWRRPPGRPPMFNLRNEPLRDCCVTSSLTRAYTDGNDNRTHAWDMRTGKLVAEAPAIHESIAAMVLTPDEKRLLVAYETGRILVRATPTLKEERRLEGVKGRVTHAAISPDGKLAVVSASDGLHVWRLADGTRVATVDFSTAREVPWALRFTSDGGTLWVGTAFGNLYRFSLRRDRSR